MRDRLKTATEAYIKGSFSLAETKNLIIILEEISKGLIEEAPNYYYLSSVLKAESGIPPNKVKIDRFNAHVNNDFVLPILAQNKETSPESIKIKLLIVAFHSHINYLFNFNTHKNDKNCESAFKTTLDYYEKYIELAHTEPEIERYIFLSLNHQVDYQIKQILREQKAIHLETLKKSLNLLNKFAEKTKSVQLATQVFIVAASLAKNDDILQIFPDHQGVVDYKNSLNICQMAINKVEKDVQEFPLLYVILSIKFMASIQHYFMNHSLFSHKRQINKDCRKQKRNVHLDRLLDSQDKNKHDEVEEIYNNLIQDKIIRQQLLKFINKQFLDCKISDGASFTVKQLVDGIKINSKTESFFTRGCMLEKDYRLIYRMRHCYLEVFKICNRLYNKINEYYSLNEIIQDPFSNESSIYFDMLHNWKLSLAGSDILMNERAKENFEKVANIDKYIKAIEAARKKTTEHLEVLENLSEKMFNQLLLKCRKKEEDLEKKFQEQLVNASSKFLQSSILSSEIELNIEEKKEVQPKENKPLPEIEFYQKGEKAFLLTTSPDISIDGKCEHFNSAIRCFAASLNIAEAKSQPNYDIIIRAQSFIADCNLGIANLIYKNNYYKKAEILYAIITKTLPTALNKMTEWEKINDHQDNLKKTIKECLLLQLQFLKEDFLAYSMYVNEKLELREKERLKARIRLGGYDLVSLDKDIKIEEGNFYVKMNNDVLEYTVISPFKKIIHDTIDLAILSIYQTQLSPLNIRFLKKILPEILEITATRSHTLSGKAWYKNKSQISISANDRRELENTKKYLIEIVLPEMEKLFKSTKSLDTKISPLLTKYGVPFLNSNEHPIENFAVSSNINMEHQN